MSNGPLKVTGCSSRELGLKSASLILCLHVLLSWPPSAIMRSLRLLWPRPSLCWELGRHLQRDSLLAPSRDGNRRRGGCRFPTCKTSMLPEGLPGKIHFMSLIQLFFWGLSFLFHPTVRNLSNAFPEPYGCKYNCWVLSLKRAGLHPMSILERLSGAQDTELRM